MSAFFCSDDTFTKAVTAIMQTVDEFDGVRTGRGSVGTGQTAADAAQAIVARLKEMNRAAMQERYPDRHGVTAADMTYRFAGFADASPIEMHKALACLSYQCCEGKVPETRCYRELERVTGMVANGIVQRLPAWERAAWD
jgi:hypothetical protein